MGINLPEKGGATRGFELTRGHLDFGQVWHPYPGPGKKESGPPFGAFVRADL